MTRTRIWLAVLAVVLAFLGFSRILEHGEYAAVEEQTARATEEASSDETGKGGVQTTEADPLVFSAGLPASRTSAGTQGSSKVRPTLGPQGPSKDSQSGGSLPEGQNETAGPPVFYTDQADDAYGRPGTPPNAALSQSAFDILRVDWAPVSYVNEQSPGGYSTSITVAGAARDDGAYVSYGEFPSDVPGEDCQLYHILTPGITAFANAICGSEDDGTRRFVGRVQGGPVTSTPTAAGGTRLVATFDNRAIPPFLQAAGRTLNNLSAFTCAACGENPGGVRFIYVLDWATSTLTYRV